MKFSLFTAVLFVSSTALAHIQPGLYRGKDTQGIDCEIDVESVTFDYDYKHPLNERVNVRVGINRFDLRHLPKINFEKNEVLPEKGVLTGFGASSTSSVAVVLKMSEDQNKHGPETLKVIRHDRDFPGYSETMTCSGLELKK